MVKSAARYAETARDEILLLNTVADGCRAASQRHPGRAHVVTLQDSFNHDVPDAFAQKPSLTHVCMVFEPLGENLLGLIERHKKRGVSPTVVKIIAKQVLLGLSYIHEECDLVHTDIKPENIRKFYAG